MVTRFIPGISGLDAATAFRVLSKDPNKYIDRFAKDKSVQKEIEYFEKKAPTYKSVDELFKDRRAMQYLLDAYGLGSEINSLGRIKKVLSEDPTNSGALANKLSDPRFKAMASALRLDQGLNKIQSISFGDKIETAYIQNEFEETLGQTDNSLRQAAYFARTASSINDVYSVLGDRVLRDVVQTVYQLPQQLAVQEVESQAAAITSRVDVKKFRQIVSESGITSQDVTRAKSDISVLEKNLTLSDAAVKEIKNLSVTLSALQDGYNNLAGQTDPAGINAGLITVQETALPELLRYEQLLNKGNTRVDQTKSLVQSMQSLLTQAANPASNLNDLKAQFADLASAIATTLGDAAVTNPYGTTENILQNGANTEVTLTIDDRNTTVTFNRYDTSDISTLIASANTAFDAISSASDTSQMITVSSRLLVTLDKINAVNTDIEADLQELNTTIDDQPIFAATLNSTDLLKGQKSIVDAQSRISAIESVIKDIRALAQTSIGRAVGADRTDLEASFTAAKATLLNLVDNTNEAGLDNLLNTTTDTSYNIRAGSNLAITASSDLKTTIYDILNAENLSDPTAANTLELKTYSVEIQTDRAKDKLSQAKPLLDRAVSYDPRATLDNAVANLSILLEKSISNSTIEGKSLLNYNSTSINFDVSSNPQTLSLRAKALVADPNTSPADTTKFDSAISDVINSLNGPTNGILSALNEAVFRLDQVKRPLESDNRNVNLEYGKIGALLDTIEADEEASNANPYKMNSFTEKFIIRYLTQVTLNNSNNGTYTGPNSFALSLFNNSQQDTSSLTANLISLSLQV